MFTQLRNNKNHFSSTQSHFLPGKWLNISLSIIFCVSLFILISCASTRDFESIDTQVGQGDFSTAYISLESQKGTLYKQTDKVLYALDSGMLSRYNGDYVISNEHLSNAEQLIQEYFAISITQTIGSYVLNDTIVDYAGEDFEDIYTNLFMALNYIQLGNTEGAFVEIRRFNNKLQLLSTKYAPALEHARAQTQREGYNADSLLPSGQSFETMEFYDSAFARYVSLLLYRSIGRMDSAQIDKNFIEKAFTNQAQLYPFPVPKAVQEEFSIPTDKERLNIFCYTGTAPEKREETVRLPGLIDDTWFKLALPIMEKNSSRVSAIHIQATDEDKNIYTGNLQVIESVENIAVDTFQQRQGLIYLKTILRAISKTAVNAGVTSAMQQSDAAQWASLFNIFANLFTEFSEQADIRSSKYFPALVWVGGINLDEGLYDVKITCYDARNNILYQQISEKVIVTSNNVNLVEAVCLQ